MHLVIFMGIQASGKSSFYLREFFRSHIRINLDMLKTRHREEILFRACLSGKASVVIDNTNLTRNDRLRYISPAKEAGYSVSGYFFQSKLAEASERNENRPEVDRVPKAALRFASSMLEIPSRGEGFDQLHFIRIEDSGFVIEPWSDEIR